MRKADLRVSIDADIRGHLDAMAKAAGKTPAAIVEEALRVYLDPLVLFETHKAIRLAQEERLRAVEDQIRVIADFVVDAYRAQAQAEPDHSAVPNGGGEWIEAEAGATAKR